MLCCLLSVCIFGFVVQCTQQGGVIPPQIHENFDPEKYDIKVVRACQHLVEPDFKIESTNECKNGALFERTKLLAFAKTMKHCFSDPRDDLGRIKLDNALLEPVCQEALSRCEAAQVRLEFPPQLASHRSQIIERNPQLLRVLSDYSFLTSRQVKALFCRKGEPFLNEALVMTLRPFVLLELLKVCAFDLNEGENEMLTRREEKEPELRRTLLVDGRRWMVHDWTGYFQSNYPVRIEQLVERVITEKRLAGELLQMIMVLTVWTEQGIFSVMKELVSACPNEQQDPSLVDWTAFDAMACEKAEALNHYLKKRGEVIAALQKRKKQQQQQEEEEEDDDEEEEKSVIDDLLVLMRTPFAYAFRRALLGSQETGHSFALTWQRVQRLLSTRSMYQPATGESGHGLAIRWLRLARRANVHFVHSPWSRNFMCQVVHEDRSETGWASLGDCMLTVLSGEFPCLRRLTTREFNAIARVFSAFNAVRGVLKLCVELGAERPLLSGSSHLEMIAAPGEAGGGKRLEEQTLRSIQKNPEIGLPNTDLVFSCIDPSLWQSQRYRDAAWEMISVQMLIDHPDQIEEAQLIKAMRDVTDKIFRHREECIRQSPNRKIWWRSLWNDGSIKSLILKWVIMRDFCHLEFVLARDNGQCDRIDAIHEFYFAQDAVEHRKLVDWLHRTKQENCEEFLNIVKTLPLSPLLLATAFNRNLRSAIDSVRKDGDAREPMQTLKDPSKDPMPFTALSKERLMQLAVNLMEDPNDNRRGLVKLMKRAAMLRDLTRSLVKKHFHGSIDEVLYLLRLDIVSLIGVTGRHSAAGAEDVLRKILNSSLIPARERRVLNHVICKLGFRETSEGFKLPPEEMLSAETVTRHFCQDVNFELIELAKLERDWEKRAGQTRRVDYE